AGLAGLGPIAPVDEALEGPGGGIVAAAALEQEVEIRQVDHAASMLAAPRPSTVASTFAPGSSGTAWVAAPARTTWPFLSERPSGSSIPHNAVSERPGWPQRALLEPVSTAFPPTESVIFRSPSAASEGRGFHG